VGKYFLGVINQTSKREGAGLSLFLLYRSIQKEIEHARERGRSSRRKEKKGGVHPRMAPIAGEKWYLAGANWGEGQRNHLIFELEVQRRNLEAEGRLEGGDG